MARRRISARAREVWTARERRVLDRLDRPDKIQKFLDALPYNTQDDSLSPRRVMRERRAHCFGGALMAAAALRYHGYGARIVDLVAVRDDDHLLAVFQRRGLWGAVGKSNFVGLRFREPIFRSVRELVLSYFESYFNTRGEKTLRRYSRPIDLTRFDHLGWLTTEEDAQDLLADAFTGAHAPIMDAASARRLARVDRRSFEAAMVGCDPKGLYRA
jgi:hypothetical protein